MSKLVSRSAYITVILVLCASGVIYGAADKLCLYDFANPSATCANCACGCTPCAGVGVVSGSKSYAGSLQCLAFPSATCDPIRKNHICAFRDGYDAPNCTGQTVCMTNVFTTLACDF